MKSLADLLKQKQDLSPLWRGVNASLIVAEANRLLLEFFGEASRQHAQAMYFKNATLTFACLSSVMAQEIKLHAKELMAKINQKFGANTVIKIKYLA